MKDLRNRQIRRVVVRGTNWVGDAVMSVPALRAVRALLPEAKITLATRSWAKGLFADADFIDEILVSDDGGMFSVASQARQWSKADFDLAILFTNSFGSALVPWLARVPLRIGYATERRSPLLTTAVPVPDWRSSRHELYYYLNIIAALESLLTGQSTISGKPANVTLNISSARKNEARELLARKGIEAGQLLVALCPGSINSRAKRWAPESYAGVADLLSRELGAKILMIGSQAEIDVTLAVRHHMQSEPVTLTGETELAQLVAVLSHVDLLITNDTGPAHIASALQTPTLVIFGPTNPLTTRPFSGTAEILRKPPECAPCMLRDCPIDHRCMTAIKPEEVFRRAQEMLKSGLAQRPAQVGNGLQAVGG